jgi:hypothetical protein
MQVLLMLICSSLPVLQPLRFFIALKTYRWWYFQGFFSLSATMWLIWFPAFQEAGGPKIPMIYGRVDVSAPEQCPPEGRLPG